MHSGDRKFMTSDILKIVKKLLLLAHCTVNRNDLSFKDAHSAKNRFEIGSWVRTILKPSPFIGRLKVNNS